MSQFDPYRIRENFSVDHGHELPPLGSYVEILEGIGEPLSCYFKGNKKKECYSFSFLRTELQQSPERFRVSTSYYVGTHWLVKNQLPVTVYPKFDSSNGEVELNYLQMLVEALKNTESAEHLEDLVEINFDQPSILISQEDDLLTPLLVIQYLQLLKRIVRKGLKKSYFRNKRNLRSRVKGKVMVNTTIKTNHARQRMLHTVCSYDEFGVDHLENRLLKKAFVFGRRALEDLRKAQAGVDALDETIRYINPAFQKVGDKLDLREVRHFKPNPLYKEYEEALKLAKLILKRYGYNITKTENQENQKIETPPFWIDMSKLFELYVLQKLREAFPGHGEVMYQPTINGRYPDYLIKSMDGNYKMVVDAKYKKYGETNVNIEDIRQVAGYARMTGVYNRLNMNTVEKEIVECLIIYPDLFRSHQSLKDIDLRAKPLEHYEGIHKLGIKLPDIQKIKKTLHRTKDYKNSN